MLRVIVCVLLVLSLFIGCSQKQETSKQEPESPSELTLPQVPVLPAADIPTNKEIQISLKNAGFYEGKIDGDIGPMSKKAILEFQAVNELVADGKIGPKTWEVLKEYLPQSEE